MLVRSRLDHDLEGLALIHCPIPIGYLAQTDYAVEDAARLNAALADVGQQLLDVGADRCGAPTYRDVVVKHGLPGCGNRLVMRHTDASHRTAGANDSHRSSHGVF